MNSPRPTGTPDTVTWRPLEVADADAMTAMMREVETVDQTGWHLNLDEVRQRLSDPLKDLARGSIAAFDGDAVVALATLRSNGASGPSRELTLNSAVRPDHRGRGFGSRLLEWVPRGARALQEAHGSAGVPIGVAVFCAASHTDAVRLYESFGYRAVRRFDRMARRLDQAVPVVRPLDGVEIVPYSADRDEEARQMKNEAFRQNWGEVPTTREQWQRRTVRRPVFQPHLSFFALDAESRAVVGVVLVDHFAAQTEATGLRDAYVGSISTLQSHRNRGIATALLASALNAAESDGFDTTSLHVDSDNEERASAVYEKAGYAVVNTEVSYSRTVDGHDGPGA
jgi:mycothiol synthase